MRGSSDKETSLTPDGIGLRANTLLLALEDGERALTGQVEFLTENLSLLSRSPDFVNGIMAKLAEREAAVKELTKAYAEKLSEDQQVDGHRRTPSNSGDLANASDPRWPLISAYESLARAYYNYLDDGQKCEEYATKASSLRSKMTPLPITTDATAKIKNLISENAQLQDEINEIISLSQDLGKEDSPQFILVDTIRDWWAENEHRFNKGQETEVDGDWENILAEGFLEPAPN